MSIRENLRLVEDSTKIINASKNLDTKISRIDFIISKLNDLKEYESKKITTTEPPPSTLLSSLAEQKEALVLKGIENETREAKEKAALAPTLSSKMNHLTKTLLKVREWMKHLRRPEAAGRHESELRTALHAVQLDALLDKARRAEFKGSKKKAVDAYLEVLYFLKHDEVDDSLQKNNITETEGKIKELGGIVG